jgi:hypothetical protein
MNPKCNQEIPLVKDKTGRKFCVNCELDGSLSAADSNLDKKSSRSTRSDNSKKTAVGYISSGLQSAEVVNYPSAVHLLETVFSRLSNQLLADLLIVFKSIIRNSQMRLLHLNLTILALVQLECVMWNT